MSNDAISRLNALRYRADSLARATPPVNGESSPGAELAAGVAGRLASEFVRRSGLDVFIPGRSAGAATRKAIRAGNRTAARNAKLAWLEPQTQSVEQLLFETEGVLKTLSIPAPSLTPTGNSKRLVRKLGKVRRYATPQSRARVLVAVLDEIVSLNPILNNEIPAFLAHQGSRTTDETIELMTNLEKALRLCVRTRLSGISPDWWSSRVPPSVRGRAERNQQRAEAVYPSVSAPEDPLSYVSFADYDDIILYDRKWEECFRPVFGDPAWISTKLGDLEPIRNVLMHSRDLTQHGLEKLRVTSRDLFARLKEA